MTYIKGMSSFRLKRAQTYPGHCKFKPAGSRLCSAHKHRSPVCWLQADVRVPDGQPLMWKVSADVEALAWSPHAPTTFLVSSEDGLVSAYDARAGAGSEPLFRLAAHDKATCALSFNQAAPNLLATASTDNMVRPV